MMRCDLKQDLSRALQVCPSSSAACDDCHKLITISEIRFTCVLVVALYNMLMYTVTIFGRWRARKKKKKTSTIFRDHYRVDSLGVGRRAGRAGVHP
jgi:predicted Na+-dependent transporter